jgi:hypothetical protein
MTVIRSRRAGIGPQEAKNRPLFARMLGLQYLRPSGLMCFLFFEGAVALSVLLALAELVNWWVVAALPAAVAAMVKVNDVIAGAIAHAGAAQRPKARGRASVPRALAPISPAPADERVGSPEQRARQTAKRRYEPPALNP